MYSLTKRVMNDNWDDLINDLQEDIIIDSRPILTVDEYTTISNFGEERQMIGSFLKTMLNKSEKELHDFIESLKQYYPWLYEKLNENVNNLKKSDQIFQIKTLGGIPNLPQKIIERTELLSQLRKVLKKLNKGDYLVLHGMTGCGKTTVAAQVLHDNELIKSCFKGHVYWLTVGKVGEEDLGCLLQELNERFPDPVQKLSPLLHLATIQMTKKLIEHNWNDCLIVLDDVKNKTVIDCFAIGAKCLVITEDKGVFGNCCESSVHYIKVNEGFNSNETLQLFSATLNIKTHLLPEQASDIHRYTKGHPLTVSLIASRLESYSESFVKNSSRWDHICSMLSDKKLRRRSLNDLIPFYIAIQDSVEALEKKYEIYFRQLAVFVEDVNIKPEVLGILWNLDKYEAENVMADFVRKSLAVMKWNEEQKSYVYGVHDLISDYLKKDLSPEQEKVLHQNLISNYETKCHGIWCNLPNDNYIYYYIGYHLRKAGKNNLFQSLYFDLAFLEAKLRVCGPADLIRDYKNYKDFITNQDIELVSRVQEFQTFVEYHGISIAEGIDIIQAALQEPTTSSVHIAAIRSAASKISKHFYLRLYPFSKVERVILPETLQIKEPINIVSFGSSVNEVIIVSGPAGRILRLYNIRAKGVLKEFKGHTGKIRNVDVSNCRTQFLSTSDDNTIRVWSLENGECFQGDRTSPRERQLNYVHFFDSNQNNEIGTDKSINMLRHNCPLLWGVFSKNRPSLIASLGKNGSLTVWDHGERKWEVNYSSSELKCIDFFDNDNFIAAGGNDEVLLFLKEKGTLYKKTKYTNFLSFRSLPGSLGGGLVILMRNNLSVLRNDNNKDNSYFSLPNGDYFEELHSVGSYIAATTKSGELYVFHFRNGSIVAHFPNMPRKASSICVNDRAILSGFSDGSLDLYPLEGLPCPLTSIKWKLDDKPVLVNRDHSQENIEVVIGNEKHIIADRSIKVERIDVSRDGNVVVMVCEDGLVWYQHLNDMKDQGKIIIMHNVIPTSIHLLENDDDEYIIVAFYEREEALMWKEHDNKLVKLNDKSIGCSSANLLRLGPGYCIITASPMVIWNLNGDVIKNRLNGINIPVNTYCVSPNYRRLVYIHENIIWLVEESLENIMILSETTNTTKITNIKFSPSSKILALYSESESKVGVLTVFNCELKKIILVREIPHITSLAVSDSGCVCFGGSNHLSVVTIEGRSSKVVFNTSSIVAQPKGEDNFAAADNAGIVYNVIFGIISGGDDNGRTY